MSIFIERFLCLKQMNNIIMIDTPTPIVTMTTPATRHEMMITNSSEFVVKEPEDKKNAYLTVQV